VPIDAPDDYRNYRQGKTTNALFASYAFAFHLVPYWLPPPHVRANAEAKETEAQVKDVLLWTYFRLLQMFPTDPTRDPPNWPKGCSSDREVVDRITTAAAVRVRLEDKIALLQELSTFERTRRSRYPDSGKPSDDARAAFKISSAAWASRFEHSSGRHMEVEDELIRVRWWEQEAPTGG
jgi:hypothetical protein